MLRKLIPFQQIPTFFSPNSYSGSVLTFDIAKKMGFEIPLVNVSHCTTIKNEVTLEFHQNDDAPVSLMELRFYVPSDTTDAEPAQVIYLRNK